ncbi:MAG TPA: PQQ-binding-like beta-propeller repeat protein [Streptosporangiaceae bacterium]|nr:PQQ-binding-like beta-propeller repeat protein [Streptosporangiaceae bacterium]
MRRFITVTAAAATVATLGALSPAAAGAADHALRAASGASARAGQAGSGARLWFRRYNDPGNGWDSASSVAVSRDGTRVFVTGTSQHGTPGANDYATVAYTAATGRKLWVRRYISGNAWGPVLVAVSRTRVFVTGTILGKVDTARYGTVAYSAATGRQLWVRRYKGRTGHSDASSIVVNRRGTAVFVTGLDGTVAYSTATGRQLWARRAVDGLSVAVNHRGTAVFVTLGGTTACNAATGRQLWALDPPLGNGTVSGHSVAVNPAGTTVFVTGTTETQYGPGPEYATAAYSASTGSQLWASYYTPPGDTSDSASSVVVNPAGTAVFVTGIRGLDGAGDYATVAYDAATGSQLWVRGYAATATDDEGDYVPPALAVSPDGTTVYFTGSSGGYRTLAYNAATGTTLWARHYSPGKGTDSASSIAVSPRGISVFVTGTSTGRTPVGDYGTIAYRS